LGVRSPRSVSRPGHRRSGNPSLSVKRVTTRFWRDVVLQAIHNYILKPNPLPATLLSYLYADQNNR
jgi:hypothetical protein